MHIKVVGEEIRIVTVLDPHFSPSATPLRKGDWLEETTESFRQILKFAESAGAALIVVAGDIFHLKTPSRNPLWFVNSVIRLFKESKVPIAGIAGNHDLAFGRIESLWDRPIGSLVIAGGMTLLDHDPVIIEMGQTKVRIEGSSYEHGSAEAVRSLRKGDANYLIGVGHFWFGPKTGEFFGEPVYGPDFLNSSEVDCYVIGHHHQDQGILRSEGKTYFVHGSMNRTGMHEDDLKRKPAVGLMTIRETSLEGKVVRLRTKPAEEVFDMEVREEMREEERKLEAFVESLAIQGMSWDDPNTLVEMMPISEEVRERAKQYLKTAEEVQ